MELFLLIGTVCAMDLLSTITPGVDFAIVTKNTLTRGKKHGLATAFGIALGVAVHITYSIIGIGALISQSILGLQILKIVGAGYLLYIGINSILSASDAPINTDTFNIKSPITPWKSFQQGLSANLLNAEATLFFVMLFGVVVTTETPLWTQILLGVIVALQELFYWSLVSTAFSSKQVQAIFYRWKKVLEYSFGGGMVAAGLVVLSNLKKS